MTSLPEPFDLASHHIAEDKQHELLRLFPEVRTEGGKIDFERLKLSLGEAVDVGKERYGMNWPGKADCRKTIQQPSLGTLRPCPGESVNFDTTENLIIEGDNLEVLKLLQKSYLGKIKMIYIDPPYNTGNDFIYPDNYTESLQTYLEYTGQVDAEGRKFGTNTEADGRFHSKWLNMMYPRLYLARNLLQEDGVIFVSIDDHEVHNMRLVMNEIFGEENYFTTVAWQRRDTPANDVQGFSTYHEYAVCYAKQVEAVTIGLVARTQAQIDIYKNQDKDSRGVWTRSALTRPGSSEKDSYPITNPTGRLVYPPKGTSWRVSKETLKRLVEEKRLWWGATGDGDMPFQKRFLSEVKQGVVPTSWWDYKFAGSMRNAKNEIRALFDDDPPFDYPKPSSLVRRMLDISTYAAEEDIILDFFAGSGTTAQAVVEKTNKTEVTGDSSLFSFLNPRAGINTRQFPTSARSGCAGSSRSSTKRTPLS